MTTENTAWVPDNIHLNHGLYELKIHPEQRVMLNTRVPYRLRHQVRTLAAHQGITMEELINSALEKTVASVPHKAAA